MGRSVSHPGGAIVAFRHYEQHEECPECGGVGHIEHEEDDEGEVESICEYCNGDGIIDCPIDWQEEDEQYQEWIKEAFPSFEPCDKWLDDEDHAIAENRFAFFGISEYCGLVALWLVSKSDDEAHWPLANRWLQQVEPKFLKTFGELTKVGTASNGESFYTKAV